MAKRTFTECHTCASISEYWDSETKDEICVYCGGKMVDIEKDIQGGLKGRDEWRDEREWELIKQYVVGNPENEKQYRQRVKTIKEKLRKMDEEIEAKSQQKARENACQPKCPTCGSTQLRRPRFLEGGYQTLSFVCLHCGYKW